MLTISVQGLSIPTSFHVLRNLRIQCILGVDFLQDSRATVDCSNKTLCLYDGLVMAPLISNFNRDSILLLSKRVTIPPRWEKFVPVRVHQNYVGQTLMTETWPSLKNRMVVAANLLIEPTVKTAYKSIPYQWHGAQRRPSACTQEKNENDSRPRYTYVRLCSKRCRIRTSVCFNVS